MALYRAAYPGLVPEDLLAGLDPGERERWRGSLRDLTRTALVAEDRLGAALPNPRAPGGTPADRDALITVVDAIRGEAGRLVTSIPLVFRGWVRWCAHGWA